MLNDILIIAGVLVLAFACGITYGYITRLLDRMQSLETHCKELRGANRRLTWENNRLKQRCESQFDRACNLNVALGETRQDVARLQEQSRSQQNQLAVKDRLLQARKETNHES